MAAANSLTLDRAEISTNLLRVCIATLVAIDAGYVLTSLARVPVSFVIVSGSVFLAAVYWIILKQQGSVNGRKKELVGLARDMNWDIVLFMLSIFIVVQGLNTAGVTNFLASMLSKTSTSPSFFGVFAPSMVVTVGASFMNNWPMTILGLLSIKQVTANGSILTSLVFSNVIGNNLGPHFFPLGSLAILMWMETMRRKGVNIRLRDYLKVGSVLSIVEVGIASLILWFEIGVFGFKL